MNTRKSWFPRTIISIICVFTILLGGATALAIPAPQVPLTQIRHVTDDIFDGYAGLETTTLGKVGFNYALRTPGGEDILLGINPNMATDNSYYNSVYNIGTGWEIKIPYIDFAKEKTYLHNPDGYKYLIANKGNSADYVIADYPITHTLSKCVQNGEDVYLLEEGYGEQKFFSADGNIIKSIDTLGNPTDYLYDNGIISEIVYSSGSSVLFERENTAITVQYSDNKDTSSFAMLYLESDPAYGYTLSAIQCTNGDSVSFEYNWLDYSPNLLLSAYTIENKYDRSINYEIVSEKGLGSYYRIESSLTAYEDGATDVKQYFYNSQGRIEQFIDGDIAETEYSYSQSNDGSITVSTAENYSDDLSISSKTINKYGQITDYAADGVALKLEYNENNKVSEEVENNLTVKHTYTEQGLTEASISSDGSEVRYHYDSDGALESKTTNAGTIFYTPSEQSVDDNNTSNSNGLASTGVQLQYFPLGDDNVRLTNWASYYGFSETSFNCYAFASGLPYGHYNPGYFSGMPYSGTLAGTKLNVEQDQQSLGRSIYDTTLAASVSGHSWKIALKVRTNVDFHFMSYSVADAAWQFKAGQSGPVMRMIYYTPTTIDWNKYALIMGMYEVTDYNFYNSEIRYMMITD